MSLSLLSWDPPASVGRFQVRSLLGHGSMGRVYSADYVDDNGVVQHYALKFLGEVEAAEREHEVLTRLGNSHVNIVRLVAFERRIVVPQRNGRPDVLLSVIVMELATNGPLFFYVIKGVLPPPVVRAFMTQLAAALAWGAALGVYHGDVKPENILFDEAFTLKLGDWGLASIRDLYGRAMNRNADAIGTLPYAAPEILTAASRAHAAHVRSGADGRMLVPSITSARLARAADAWSSGVVLFVLIVGRNPFNYASTRDPFYAKTLGAGDVCTFWAQHEAVRGAPFDSDTKDAINALLTVDPEQRSTLEDVLRMPFFTQHRVASQAESAAALIAMQAAMLTRRSSGGGGGGAPNTAAAPPLTSLSSGAPRSPGASAMEGSEASDAPLSSAVTDPSEAASAQPVFRASPLCASGDAAGGPQLVAWQLPEVLLLPPWHGGAAAPPRARTFASRLTTREYAACAARDPMGVSALLEEARACLATLMYGIVRLHLAPLPGGLHEVELHAFLPCSQPDAAVHLVLAAFAAPGGGVGVDVTRGLECGSALEFAHKATALLEFLDERLLAPVA